MHHLAKTSLVAKRFSADFSDITLTQIAKTNPLVINGVGTINQDELGTLKLKLFQKNPLDREKVLRYQEEKSRGRISSAGGCSLSAVDHHDAGTWTCDYLKTSESLYFGTDGCTGVFSAEVEKLENSHGIRSCFQKSSFEGIIPFELDLPFNRGADGKKNSYPERMLKFTFNKVTKVEILQCNGYTSIKINNKYELVSERFIEAFTQSLSIATGRTVKYIWRQIAGEHFHHNVISEFDFELSRKSLRPPLDLHFCGHFLEFLEAYIKFSLTCDHNYFGYWEKLHASWASGLAVAALPLAVYIEGIMKEFFPELMTVDAKLAEDVKLTVEAIDNLVGVEAKLRERIRNRISGAARGTVTNGLRALAQRGCIGDHLVTSWQSVRHRSAHGNDFTQGQVAKFQEIVTGIYSCLRLFYELLYLKLEFSGHIIDYSEIGFPTEFRHAERLKMTRK